MKRYAVFYGDHYYPYGGWDDFKGYFHTLAECERFLLESKITSTIYDWYQIVDTHSGKIVQKDM